MFKVSVIIPCYNHEKFIGRCLRSILDQSLNKKQYEVIVVDDGSSDNSSKVMKTFGNLIKIITNKKNKGLPHSLNTGIRSSKSKYIVRLDSDDYVNRDFLSFLLQYIEQNSNTIDAVACDYLVVNDQEEVLRRENCEKKPIGCGIIFKTSHLIKLGLYNESFLLKEEVELRKRYEQNYKISRLQLPLYRYRRHEKNITNNKKKLKKFTKLLKRK
jgi:glycosyltransferase involved in cell wall biosynthesis|tara:strand:+ start:59 stop:700 length:642 start_codon:yes stop_codon:yes gene_type:complete